MQAALVYEGITEQHLEQVYSDPYIAKVGHDHRPASPVIHPLATYLTATVNGAFAGAFLAIRTTALNIDLHALLLRDSVRHSRRLGMACLQWAFETHPIERVTALVIEGLESAKNYCLRLGFAYEGYQRHAVMQHGILKGIHMLGMTRADWSQQ